MKAQVNLLLMLLQNLASALHIEPKYVTLFIHIH
jgi:hypothetical protein